MIPTHHTGSKFVCQMRSGDESWDTKVTLFFGCRGGVWKEEGLHPMLVSLVPRLLPLFGMGRSLGTRLMLVWFVHLVYSDYQLHTVHRRSVGHPPLASPCHTPGILRSLFQVVHVFTLCTGGVTPIDSIVTAATAGQNFDWLSSAV